MPSAGQAMTLLCHIVGEGTWVGLGPGPASDVIPSRGDLKAQLQPHSCASVGSHLGACSEWAPPLLSLPSRPQCCWFIFLWCVDEDTQTLPRYYVT